MTASKTSPDPEDIAPAERASGYLKVGVPVGTLVLSGIAGAVQGPPLAILVLAGGALVAVIATFWSSVRTLFGETPLSGADAYALGAPRTEEEQKQAVLRALKDLEFERSVGKISEEDYKILVAKYRAEAKRLLRILDTDAAPRRAYVEALVAKRLKREGLLADGAASAEPVDDDDESDADDTDADVDSDAAPKAEVTKPKPAPAKAPATTTKKKPAAAAKSTDRKKKPAAAPEKAAKAPAAAPEAPANSDQKCPSCETTNDNDAAFCKKCGARLSPPSSPRSSDNKDASTLPDDGAGAQ